MDNDQPALPLDERFRQAEQLALELPEPKGKQPPPPDFKKEESCGRVGFCYCPKCNPR